MSDDLVKRLRADELPGDRQRHREARTVLWSERHEAADRIERLEAALRELGRPIALADPEGVYRYPDFTPQDAIDMHSLLLNRIIIANNALMTEADFEEARNRKLGVNALEGKDD